MRNHGEPRRTMACKRLQCIPFYWIIWVSSLRRIEMAGKAGCSSPQVGTVRCFDMFWHVLTHAPMAALFRSPVLSYLVSRQSVGNADRHRIRLHLPNLRLTSLDLCSLTVMDRRMPRCHETWIPSRWSQHFHLDVYSTSNAIPVVSSTSFWGFQTHLHLCPTGKVYVSWGMVTLLQKKNAAQLNRLQGWLFRGDRYDCHCWYCLCCIFCWRLCQSRFSRVIIVLEDDQIYSLHQE